MDAAASLRLIEDVRMDGAEGCLWVLIRLERGVSLGHIVQGKRLTCLIRVL